jgi:hypothetical protein
VSANPKMAQMQRLASAGNKVAGAVVPAAAASFPARTSASEYGARSLQLEPTQGGLRVHGVAVPDGSICHHTRAAEHADANDGNPSESGHLRLG